MGGGVFRTQRTPPDTALTNQQDGILLGLHVCGLIYKCDIPFWFLFLCMWLLAKPHHHNWRLFLVSLKLSVVR